MNIARVLFVLVAFGLVLSSCKEELETYPDIPEDVTIPIDENQSFNMKNFLVSHEQLFVPTQRYKVNYSHEFLNGKAQKTYQNRKLFGKFGIEIKEFVHTYNSDGVLVYSQRTSKDDFEIVTYYYEFDAEGYISKLYKIVNETIRDIVVMSYNSKAQLLSKTTLDAENQPKRIESFEYDTNGNVIKFLRNNELKYEWLYDMDNMVEEKFYNSSGEEQLTKYKYNNDNLVVEIVANNASFSTYQYDNASFIKASYGSDDKLLKKIRYIDYINFVDTQKFYYNQSDDFSHCIQFLRDDQGKSLEKKIYYDGNINNLNVKGYVIVDEILQDYIVTSQSFYSSFGRILYTFEYDPETKIVTWKDPEGTVIDPEKIVSPWVLEAQ